MGPDYGSDSETVTAADLRVQTLEYQLDAAHAKIERLNMLVDSVKETAMLRVQAAEKMAQAELETANSNKKMYRMMLEHAKARLASFQGRLNMRGLLGESKKCVFCVDGCLYRLRDSLF